MCKCTAAQGFAEKSIIQPPIHWKNFVKEEVKAFWHIILYYIISRCTCPLYESTLQKSQQRGHRVQFQCNANKKGGKCTCHSFQFALQRSLWGESPSSTPMQSWQEGRQVHWGALSQLCTTVGEVHVQLLMDFILVHGRPTSATGGEGSRFLHCL